MSRPFTTAVTTNAPDGTVSAPGWSFASGPSNGIYLLASNNPALAINGIRTWDFAATATGVRYGSADAVAYELAGYKTRGSVASPTVITSGDDLLRIAGYGYGGASGYVKAAEILFDSAGTIADTQVGGSIVLRTATTAAPSVLTDRLTIDNTGLATFAGAVTISGLITATGGQIAFPAAQSASTNVNTLDDYEEGTWTPSVGGNATYTTQTGRYIKVGKKVFIAGSIAINVLGTGSTTTVSGLPFGAVSGSLAYAGSVGYFSSLAISVVWIQCSVNNGAATLQFETLGAAGATATDAGAIFGNSARIDFTATYEASA